MESTESKLRILKVALVGYALFNIILAIIFFLYVHEEGYYLFRGLLRGAGVLFFLWLMFKTRNKWIYWYVYFSTLFYAGTGIIGLISLLVIYFTTPLTTDLFLQIIPLIPALVLLVLASWCLSNKEMRKIFTSGRKDASHG